MTDLTFVPYVRRGLAAAITAEDPLTGAFGAPATVEATVTVEGRTISRPVELLGAGTVTGLGSSQVVRCEPRPGATDVEPNYFAACELAAPDLPWLMTPAAPAGDDRLRPWIVLVVVRRQEGVTIAAPSGNALAVLTIETPADPAAELPDLAESWAWAHVQAAVPVEEMAAAIESGAPSVVARLLAPRRLDPDTGYYACVVPALDGAVQRGLGGEPDPALAVAPAWELAALAERIDLPVYHWWEFTTGAAGDFESLARRLQPDSDEAVMGLHAMDVGAPGLVPSAPDPVIVDMEGALTTLDAEPRAWPRRHRADFVAAVEPLLDAAIAAPSVVAEASADYDPLVDDPLLTPPAYGAAAAGVTELPQGGWVRGVNVDPVARAMAGLGAAVVRAAQEELVAAAWDQAGDLRAAASLVSQTCLAAEIAESWARRMRSLADADVLQVTSVLHPLLDDGAASVRTALRRDGVPAGMFTAAYARQTRPGTTLWRDWRRRTSIGGPTGTARVAADVATTMLAATDPAAGDDVRPALAYAAYVVPSGTQTFDPTLRGVTAVTTAPRPSLGARATGPIDPDDLDGVPIDVPIDVPTTPTGPTGRAAAVRVGLVPRRAARASAVARMPALDAVLAADTLPAALRVAPTFDDALYWDLLGLGATWLVPGIHQLGANRVRLLAVNSRFVGAFLVGANTAIVSELRWRDYPIAPRATCFHRFFHYVADPDRVDIGELADWETDDTIEENMNEDSPTGEATMTAIVVRGDLVRRYPTAHWFLQPAVPGDADGEWVAGDPVVELAFVGALDTQTAVYGFDLDPDDVRGHRAGGVGGYFVGVEEQLGAPRFGLDTAAAGHFDNTPRHWDKASWGHVVSSQTDLDALQYAPATGGRLAGVELDGATWGRNSAHLARATWQRPFRLLIHADLLI